MMGIGNDIRTIAPYHAKQAMPLFEIQRWVKDAQPGQSFIVKDGPIKSLPFVYRMWLGEWEADGFITFAAIKASPAGLSSHHDAWRVHVTRTEAEL